MIARITLLAMLAVFLLFFVEHKVCAQIFPGPAADYNADGVVDMADYTAWKRGYGMVFATNSEGDGNGDGMVDAIDYFVWKSEFGLSLDTFPTGLTTPPRISVDLVRDALDRPVLDSDGKWQLSVSIIPNANNFENYWFDVPDQGSGSAMAIELGLEIFDEFGDVHTAVSNLSPRVSGQLYENDPNWDGNAIDPLGLNNPGISPFGGLVDSEGLDAVGNQIDAALGTIFLNSDNGGQGHELFTFSAGRPATDDDFGGLQLKVNVLGGYGLVGRYYRVVQGNEIRDYPSTYEFFSYDVLVGDVNLDGVVNTADLQILEASLGHAGKWTDGDLTGEGLVDASDRNILLAILVPEPSSALLILLLGWIPLATRIEPRF